MRSAPETGESTRSIIEAANGRSWQEALPRLRAGSRLTKPSAKLPYYYVDGMGGLTPAFVRKLEREGFLRRVGVDTYALAEVGPNA